MMMRLLHRPFHRGLGVLCAGILCLLAAACAARGPFPPLLQLDQRAEIVDVLADAYEKASENYVHPLAVADIALGGLRDVLRMHTPMSVHDDGQTVTVRFFTEEPPLLRRARPAADDIAGWSDLVADALIAVTARSSTPSVPPLRILQIHMEGVAKAMGPDVEYLSDEHFRAILFGRFDSGISFRFRKTAKGLEVTDLDPDGHLEAEGLRPGDIITAVDNADVAEMKPARLNRLLAGQEGTQVTLSVLRGSPPQPTYMRFTRWKYAPIPYQMVRHGGTLVFRFPDLNARAARDFATVLVQQKSMAKRGGQPFDGVVLDLRGTTGNGAFSTVDIANVFLGDGVISIERWREPGVERVIGASWPDSSDAVPLVVLVDGRTESGAAVLTAALQDNGRAVVIGSSVVGEGMLVHNITLYNMGVLRMPVARLIAPSGYALEGRGILPDICIGEDTRSVKSWMAALQRGEGLIDLAARTRLIDPDDAAALAAHRAVCPAVPDPMTFDPTLPRTDEEDVAEDVALGILRDLELYKRLLRPSPNLQEPE